MRCSTRNLNMILDFSSELVGILFYKKYIYVLVSSRSENLIEQLVTCLRKSNESEGQLAAIVTSLFIIQLGESNDELFIKFRDAIIPILRDESKS
ncbi:unnamed protein product [Rotaria sp. Silwood2]|nr:unnamed protein product [Rotaria sp. Silwood2]